jgi:hypothetical protein
MAELIVMKHMYIMPPEPVSTAQFMDPIHNSNMTSEIPEAKQCYFLNACSILHET